MKKLLLMLTVIMVAVSTTSCSKKDDDGGNGSISALVGTWEAKTEFTLKNGSSLLMSV